MANTIEYGQGAVNNTIGWGQGAKVGSSFSNAKSIALDGVDDYVTTSSAYTELDGQTKATISLWVKPSFGGFQILSILARNPNQSNFVYRLFMDASGKVFFQLFSAFRSVNTGTNLLTENVWNHLLVSYDGSLLTGSKAKIFINGIDSSNSDNNDATSLSNTIYPLEIGRNTVSNNLNFNGKIDEFAIWSGQDFRSDVDAIYNGGVPNDLNNNGLTAPTTWYRMGDGDTAPTIQDTNGSADLTMTNFSTFSTDVPT